MTNIEAMKLALDALNYGLHVGFDESSESQIKKCTKAFQQSSNAIAALRQQISEAEEQKTTDYMLGFSDGKQYAHKYEQAEQEPVAWHEPGAYGNVTVYEKWAKENGWQPLYTAPPQREWVSLTDDERIELAGDIDWAIGAYSDYARAIEAKLKEKNCGAA